jgi:hypothetical protein
MFVITAHTVRACKDEGMNLPWQALGDAITTAWPELMRDLERNAEARASKSFEALEDEIVRLKTKLESSQSALTKECDRIERRDETIRVLNEEIGALKRPQSMTSATTTSSWPTVPTSSVAGPSSRQTAPLPARARSSLASRMAQPGLASCLEMPPETD